MRFVITLFLISSALAQASNLDVVPVLPATCHDGQPHTDLNGIRDLEFRDEGARFVFNFKVYLLDCETRDGTVFYKYRGPLHQGRCDHSTRTYPGVRLKSKIVPLSEADPVPVCQSQISFEKQKLQPGPNEFKYIYRWHGNQEYHWKVTVLNDGMPTAVMSIWEGK